MNIETGPSGATGISVGGVVNEGSVRGSLEGFRTMNTTDITTIDKGGTTKPLGEIVFNPSTLTAEVAIAQAEAIISEARISQNPVTSQSEQVSSFATSPASPDPHNGKVEQPVPIGANLPGLDLQVQPEVRGVIRQATAPTAVIQTEAVYAPALAVQEQLVEQIVKEKQVKVEDKVEKPSQIKNEEEVEELKVRYVEDEAVSAQRRYEIKEAIRKAKLEAEEEGVDQIEGSRIEKYLPSQHLGNRSQIAREGIPDGSLEETYQDLAARDYTSGEEANRVAESIIADKKPVRKAQNGPSVRTEDIARVRKDPVIKRHPVEEVVRRIIKKSKVATVLGQISMEVTSAVKTEEITEGRIEDYPDLAEVFEPKQVA